MTGHPGGWMEHPWALADPSGEGDTAGLGLAGDRSLPDT